MIKQVLLSTFLLIFCATFSQIDLEKKIIGKLYIADDGTFFNIGLSSDLRAFDADGKLKFDKKIKGYMQDSYFDSKNKRWFHILPSKGKVTFRQMDEHGNVGEMDHVSDAIKAKSEINFYMNSEKEIEIHILQLETNKVSIKDKYMPYLILKYNSDTKTVTSFDFKSSPDKMDDVTYLGHLDSKWYFVNSDVDNKNLRIKHTLYICSKSEMKAVELSSVNFMKSSYIKYPVLRVRPLTKENDKLYFVLNYDNKNKNAMRVFELSDDDELQHIDIDIPDESLRDFPIYYSDKESEIEFIIKDVWNNRFVVEMDFDNEDSAEGSLYTGEFSDLFKISKNESGYDYFRICNGYGRLIIVSNSGKAKLYLREVSEEE